MSNTGLLPHATLPAAPLLWPLVTVCLALACAASLRAAAYDYDVHAAAELRARDGLPNLVARAQAGDTVRVAYVGGSITAAGGWRPKTLAWLRQQYPKATLSLIHI